MTSIDGYNQEYTTESYLSRARYNFAERYFLDASFRRDVLHVSPIRGVISGRWVQAGLSLRRSS